MNIRQKIGLGIMAPLCAIAIGHTVINKLNNKNTLNYDVNINNALKAESDSAAALYKGGKAFDLSNDVKLYPLRTKRSFRLRHINVDLAKENNYTIKEQAELAGNYVECGD